MSTLFIALLLALALDYLLGEVKAYHPLVGFGKCADFLESRLNRNPSANKRFGVLALILTVAPFLLLCFSVQYFLSSWLALSVIFNAAVLYMCVGWHSLRQHAEAVLAELVQGDLPAAREQLSRIVSRDTSALDQSQVVSATIESVLENGNDAIFATLFWFCLFGATGALAYRLVNTLDAMWGYRNPRYCNFGWAAARLDDCLNWIPARLTALAYAVMGHFASAIECWRNQAAAWKSPNAGPVMAAGAGALKIVIGGDAKYAGQQEHKPSLGCGVIPQAPDINAALALINRSLVLWLCVLFFIL